MAPDLRDLEKSILGDAFLRDSRGAAVHDVTVWNEQLRVVEWSTLAYDPRVRQRTSQERDEVVDLVGRQLALARRAVALHASGTATRRRRWEAGVAARRHIGADTRRGRRRPGLLVVEAPGIEPGSA